MMYAKSAVTATASTATVERAPRFRDRRRHLLPPSLFLTLEDAAGDLDESPGAVQRKPFAPRLRHVREVLGGEHPSRGASLRAGQLVHADASHNVGEQVRGVPDGIAQGDRIEVDEHHSLTAQEHVVSLHVAMDRRGGNLLEPLSDRVADRLDLAPRPRAGPLEQLRRADPSRSEEHTSELQSRQYLVCRLLLEKKKNKQ